MRKMYVCLCVSIYVCVICIHTQTHKLACINREQERIPSLLPVIVPSCWILCHKRPVGLSVQGEQQQLDYSSSLGVCLHPILWWGCSCDHDFAPATLPRLHHPYSAAPPAQPPLCLAASVSSYSVESPGPPFTSAPWLGQVSVQGNYSSNSSIFSLCW